MGRVVTYSDNTLYLTDTGTQVNDFTLPLDSQDYIENIPGGVTRVVRNRQVVFSFNRYTELSPALVPPALFTGSATQDQATIVEIYMAYDAANASVWVVVYSNEDVEYYSDTPFGTPVVPILPLTKDAKWEDIAGTLIVSTVVANTIVLSPGAKYVYVKNTGGGAANVSGFGSALVIPAGTNQEIWSVQTDPVNNHYLTSPEITIDASATTITTIEYR
jgi:hypothetical protein